MDEQTTVRETVPDRMRIVADGTVDYGNATYTSAEEAAASMRIMLAQCVATLRMAAAAWPAEVVRPVRPPATRGRVRVVDDVHGLDALAQPGGTAGPWVNRGEEPITITARIESGQGLRLVRPGDPDGRAIEAAGKVAQRWAGYSDGGRAEQGQRPSAWLELDLDRLVESFGLERHQGMPRDRPTPEQCAHDVARQWHDLPNDDRTQVIAMWPDLADALTAMGHALEVDQR